MKEYTIARCTGTPDWNKIPSLVIREPLRPAYANTPIKAQAQICYDDEALYVRLTAVEEHIRAEHHGPLGEICEDSCLEFFFCPMAGDPRYFNIECNPNGALYLGLATNGHNLVRFIPEEPSILPQPKYTDGGWEVTYTVPYTFIRQFFPEFAPVSGYSIRANCYKCGDLTVQPHCLCWNPVPILPYASFHNPEAFGLMHFA